MKLAPLPKPRPGLPKRTFIERVMIPRRLHDEPESGLESIIGAMTPMMFAAAGLPIVGDMFHALQVTAEVHDGLKPETMTQAELQARRTFSQNTGQPTLNMSTPIVMVPSERTVEQTIDPLDPEMGTLDPNLAARYRQSPRPGTLGEACALRADATQKPTLSSDFSKEAKAAEMVPWRLRR